MSRLAPALGGGRSPHSPSIKAWRETVRLRRQEQHRQHAALLGAARAAPRLPPARASRGPRILNSTAPPRSAEPQRPPDVRSVGSRRGTCNRDARCLQGASSSLDLIIRYVRDQPRGGTDVPRTPAHLPRCCLQRSRPCRSRRPARPPTSRSSASPSRPAATPRRVRDARRRPSPVSGGPASRARTPSGRSRSASATSGAAGARRRPHPASRARRCGPDRAARPVRRRCDGAVPAGRRLRGARDLRLSGGGGDPHRRHRGQPVRAGQDLPVDWTYVLAATS